ncbi:MAG: type IV pilus modification PilV family protein [Marinobacter sp.]|uniref:type IV pilus modification PilV family protein n=1 Tax=Marinobacter sp. TaxID=50741 RepID=UPI001AB65FB5
MRRKSVRGATLVELVMTIVIISVAIAGVLGAFSLLAGRSADPLNQTRAVSLSQLYADEIQSRRYDDSTPTGGTPRSMGCLINTEESDRAEYDDVDDYDAINNEVPRKADGSDLDNAAYGGFRVSVDVVCAGGEVGLPENDAKRVDITVLDPAGSVFVFTLYRVNF